MNKVVKYIANKKNTYLPYLWDIRLKIKGRYICLDNVSKNQRFGRIVLSHCARNYKGGK